MRTLFGVVVALIAACATVKWSGGGPPPEMPEHVRLTDEPAPARPEASLPEATALQKETAKFYSDLGPESVDLAQYPAQQRHNYRVYASACSRCHGLARSLNAPIVDRKWWEFYILGMRLRGKFAGRSLTKAEVKAVLDFLEYDGRERKAAHRKEFEARTEELKRRFELLLDERMERLQKDGQPALLGR